MSVESKNLVRNFSHLIIPAEIWLRRDMSLQAKCLWAEIRSLHCPQKGGCYASDEYLCEFMDLKKSRLSEVLKEIKDLGLLEIVSFDGRKIVRRAVVPETKYQETSHEKMSYPENRVPQIRDPGYPTIYNKKEDRKEYKGNAPKPPNPKPSVSVKGSAKALPFQIQKEKELPVKSKARQFPRLPDHQARFDYLMSLQLTDDKNHVSEDEMSFLSHKYSMEKLENAFCHMAYRQGLKGLKPKSRIAIFKFLLKNEHCPVGTNVVKNTKFADDFSVKNRWFSLRILDKYVEDKNFSGSDISLNINPKEFEHSLNNLFNSLRNK